MSKAPFAPSLSCPSASSGAGNRFSGGPHGEPEAGKPAASRHTGLPHNRTVGRYRGASGRRRDFDRAADRHCRRCVLMRAHHPDAPASPRNWRQLPPSPWAPCLTPDREFAAALGIVLAHDPGAQGTVARFGAQRHLGSDSSIPCCFGHYLHRLSAAAIWRLRTFWLFRPPPDLVVRDRAFGGSFVGYFLSKFSDPVRGGLLAAIVGALASTTHYHRHLQAVEEAPDSAVPAARNALIANSDPVSADGADSLTYMPQTRLGLDPAFGRRLWPGSFPHSY